MLVCLTLLELYSQKILYQQKIILTDAKILVKVRHVALSNFKNGKHCLFPSNGQFFQGFFAISKSFGCGAKKFPFLPQ